MATAASLEAIERVRRVRAHLVATASALSLSVALTACTDDTPRVILEGADGPITVSVELALTQEEQARGLMWRNELPEMAGMLFVFRAETMRSFWMKNTPLPLDIIYISRDLRIVSIARNTKPFSTESIPSGGPAKYVLEVGGGFCAKHGVDEGSVVKFENVPERERTQARKK